MIAVIIAAVVLGASALSLSLYTLLEYSARWYVDAEFTEAMVYTVNQQGARLAHLEKAIRQCWPTFKSYGE